MPFGKHRGKALEDVPLDYLEWVLAECGNITPILRRAIQQILSPPQRSGALTVAGVADQWYRRLAVEFHPDKGGTHEAMKAVNRGRELLLELVGGAR
jgi:hypothetical protein